MLTSKERRDLEAHWNEERIMRTTALMKASVLVAALVGLLWIGLAADTSTTSRDEATATSQDAWRSNASRSAEKRAREVFEERRARWSGRYAPSMADVVQRDE